MAAKQAANGATKSEDEVTAAIDQVVTPPPPAARIEPVLIKPIDIKLDPNQADDYYQLRMTNAAMQIIEDMLGINMWNGIGGVSNIKARHVAIMIWSCLLWKFPDMKLEELERLPGMDMANFVYVVTRLDAVVYGHLPESDATKDSAEADPNASSSAGSNSGQSDA